MGPKSARKGFSLVESIVSVTLAAVFSLSTVSVLPNNLLMERRSINAHKVTTLGQTVLEEQRARPFESMRPGTSVDLGTLNQDGLEVRGRVRFLADADCSPERYREVRVELNWQEHGRVRTMVLQSGVCAH